MLRSKFFSKSLIIGSFFLSTLAFSSDEEVSAILEKGEAVTGWMHASVHQHREYVFTWRDPENFFRSFHYPLIPTNADIQEALLQLSRHDKVAIKGQLKSRRSPQKHLYVTELIVLEDFEAPVEADPYEYNAKIPDELLLVNEATFKVHAIAGQGRVLVVEYKDVVLPVFVRAPQSVAHLYRNDKIRMRFELRRSPGRPQHLELLPSTDEAPNIVVLRPIVAGHNRPITIEGHLVMFPKSPQILFNVFAVRQVDPDGTKTNFTLLNFEDQDLFRELRQTLQAAWDQAETPIRNDRNKYVQEGITLRVSGTKNVVSASQANPQILVNSLDDIEIIQP